MKWRPVHRYEGFYLISTTGLVKSAERRVDCRDGSKRIFKGRTRKQSILSNGYLGVSLHKQGFRRLHSTHRLVAEAFIPNPEGKPQINHKNGIKTDNRVENLEWCTRSENTSHAYQHGLIQTTEKQREFISKLGLSSRKPVRCIETSVVYSSAKKATQETGIHQISRAANKKRETAGGFRWEWVQGEE